MENFKSYGRRKVSLDLKRGLTVVSGPNGCGKSNIFDAIQFVLGQLSSKTIRTESLSGVIFSGTKEEHRRASFAKVTLILDNSKDPKEIPIASNEVHIIRKVDSDGRSQYYLNGSRITRGEIIDTLGMCGISLDGYNVIRQGEIAKFSDLSPIEIRELFEEIAGIAAYDEKKEKAQQNLEKARTKLRIANVRLEESEKKLKQLENEKRDALRYQELQVKIKNTEAKLLHARIRKLKEETKEKEKRIKTIQEKQKDYAKSIEQMKIGLEAYENQLDEENLKVQEATGKKLPELSAKMEELNQKLSIQQATRNQLQEKITGLTGAIKELNEQEDHLTEENQSLQNEEISLQKQLKGREEQIKALQEELTEKKDHLDNLRSTEKMDQLEEIRTNKSEFSEQKAEIESQLAILNNKLSINDSKIEDKEKRVVEVAGILAHILSKKNSYLAEINELEQEISKLQVRVDESKLELDTVEKELKENEEQIRERAVTIKRIQTEMATTKRIMEEIMSGDKATKLILEARENGEIEGIYGTVGELCKTHPKYSLALNITAGNRINYIVVEDDKTAARCIEKIKKAKAGRITFLPLNKLKPLVINPQIRDKEVIGRAIDLVKFEPKYRKAIEYVFGQTLIVKNLDAARRVGFSYRAVTLEGDVVNPSGSMTGGYYKGKKQERIALIVKDEAKLPQLETELGELQEERDRLVDYRTAIARELNDELLPQLSDNIRNRDLRERDLKSTKEEIQLRSEENIGIQNELQQLTDEHLHLENEINELISMKKDLSETLLRLQEAETELKEAINRSGFQELMDEIKQKEQFLEELQEEKRELEMTHFKKESQIEDNKKKISDCQTERVEKEKEKPTIEKQHDEVIQQITTLDNQYSVIKERRDEIIETIQKSNDEMEKLKGEQRALRKRLEEDKEIKNQQLILIERLQTERKEANNKITELEEFATEQDLPYIFAEDEVMDVEVLNEVLTGFQAELESMPEINMKAITQYEEELELNQELVERKQFVEKDFNAIKQAINEIETEKRKKFMKVFEGISKNFNRIFGILSSGGRARLDLEDSDDPFNGGISVMANPGGKKIISMLSLSGGEKSLTALALVFAIQRYKPAPFYVFDEIDAFLDVNNVSKVATLVREMSKTTQIIIISLRAPMIAAAEKIFGVTAGENHISQIVSVSLDEIMKIVETNDMAMEAASI
jgi:chromosome segregation protein